MSNVYILNNQRFGLLTVLYRVENSKDNKARWLCQCDCGNKTITKSKYLRSGETKSCGCLRKLGHTGKYNIHKIHSVEHNRLYNIWQMMKQRCYNPKATRYKRYGARGITVCDEWINDFKSFYNWSMNNGYKNDLTIDRIDNDQGYSPNNCRWATIREQNNNKGNKGGK